jgi:hypothetical protein
VAGLEPANKHRDSPETHQGHQAIRKQLAAFAGMIEAFFIEAAPHDIARLTIHQAPPHGYKGDGIYGDGPDFHLIITTPS